VSASYPLNPFNLIKAEVHPVHQAYRSTDIYFWKFDWAFMSMQFLIHLQRSNSSLRNGRKDSIRHHYRESKFVYDIGWVEENIPYHIDHLGCSDCHVQISQFDCHTFLCWLLRIFFQPWLSRHSTDKTSFARPPRLLVSSYLLSLKVPAVAARAATRLLPASTRRPLLLVVRQMRLGALLAMLV
jgi:hypothetical protein